MFYFNFNLVFQLTLAEYNLSIHHHSAFDDHAGYNSLRKTNEKCTAVTVAKNRRWRLRFGLLWEISDSGRERHSSGLHGKQRELLWRSTFAGESLRTVLSHTQATGCVRRRRCIVQVFWYGRTSSTMAATAVRSEEENLHQLWSRLQFRSGQQVNNVGGCYGLKGWF